MASIAIDRYRLLSIGHAGSKDFLSFLTLRGIVRKALHTVRRAPPVTPDTLLLISMVLVLQHDAQSSTLFCAFLFDFFLMAHLATVVPSSCKSFDPRRHLTSM